MAQRRRNVMRVERVRKTWGQGESRLIEKGIFLAGVESVKF